MKYFTTRLTGLISRPLERLQRRFRETRRGSVLILVVALLVLLTLMGTAYVSSTRLERAGVVAGNSNRILIQTAQSYANQKIEEVKSNAVLDALNLVTCPTDDTATTKFLASRDMRFLLDYSAAGPWSPNGPVKTVPTWAAISRVLGVKFESPWTPPAGSVQYDAGSNIFMAPTNIVISYPAGGQTDPNLVGQTRTFPGFMRYVYSGTGYLPDGPYLAADATGMGIPDSGLIPLSTTPIQGVYFYGAVRVIDNNSAFNLNTAWGRHQDLDGTLGGSAAANKGNCANFFPCDLDFLGAMNIASTPTYAAGNEMNQLDFLRYSGLNQARYDDKVVGGNDVGAVHNDLAYLNNADEFWMQLGRRPDYPNFHANFGNQLAKYIRPFGDPDFAAITYRGGMVDQANSLSGLDSQMNQGAIAGKDSIYAGAINTTGNPVNQFHYLAANNVGYYFDWYHNFENRPAANGTGMNFPIAALGNAAPKAVASSLATGGGTVAFRSLRDYVVASNPVGNLCRYVDFSTIPTTATAPTVPNAAKILPMDPTHPRKASLNTDNFPELWRAVVNVMAGSAAIPQGATFGPFQVPNDDTTSPGVNNGSMFRNPLRHPNSKSTKSNNFTSLIDQSPVTMDSKSVLTLRAALAAVNVMTLRNQNGYSPAANQFIPDPVRQSIAVKTTNGEVQALVYGVTANPYIAEVYVNTDQTDHGGKANDKGFVAIKLYNPNAFAIDLKDYQFAVVDRHIATYPNMPVKLLAALNLPAPVRFLASNSAVLMTNYSAAGGVGANPNTKYWPKGSGLPDVPASRVIIVPDLHKVFEDSGVEKGGELVLLRMLQHGGTKPEVPVDSYDFSGLLLKGKNAPSVDAWHYIRTIGTTPPADRWKCVYAGEYDASKTPRLVGTDAPDTYDPTMTDPWESTPPKNLHLDPTVVSTTATYAIPYTGIELCNTDFGGFNKYQTTAATAKTFPFGGFARVGDVIQAPFIGSYVIIDKASYQNVSNNPPYVAIQIPAKVMEINPVTIDTSVADDGDQSDDGVEQIGRFCPIDNTGTVNDYFPWGYYRTTDPGTPPAAPNGVQKAHWRYRFAMNLLDQFTVVSNPESDYYPNMNPASYLGAGVNAPAPVPNSPGTITNPNTNNEFGTEGLLNINSAGWRMIAAMEMIPAAKGGNAKYLGGSNPQNLTNNQMLAQFIVRYRDIDDGVQGRPFKQGHGPFTSLMELNSVFDPNDVGVPKTKTFQTALGLFGANAADPTYYEWGNYSPGPKWALAKGKAVDNKPDAYDWMQRTIMVNRISNLVTLRSDSFTAYVIVQGWRNIGTAYPELVVQKRLAVLIDRTSLGNGTGATGSLTPRTYSIPTD